MIRKQLSPILFLFVLTNTILLFSNTYYATHTVFKFKFIMVVNLMLFSMSIYNFIRLRNVDEAKPSAMVRSVMVGTLLKMVIFAGAALAYATQKKAPVGYPTLLSSMGLYLIYTWLEIRWTKITN
jgi:hypothetical protein